MSETILGCLHSIKSCWQHSPPMPQQIHVITALCQLIAQQFMISQLYRHGFVNSGQSVFFPSIRVKYAHPTNPHVSKAIARSWNRPLLVRSPHHYPWLCTAGKLRSWESVLIVVLVRCISRAGWVFCRRKSYADERVDFPPRRVKQFSRQRPGY